MIGTLGLQGRLNWTWGVPYLFKRPCNTALLHLGFSRTVSVKGVEPIDCVPTRNETAWILPGFSCRDLVSILIKHNGEGAERRLVVCSAYLPYDSENPLPSNELEELVWYCENENLYLVVGCDSNAHHSVWGSTNCNIREEALVEFLNF